MKLGERIEEIAALDARIDSKEAALRKLKQKRAKLETKLLKAFDKDAIDGCKVKHGTARIRKADFPSIKDRKAFDAYVLKNKALDLFQNRVSSTAWKARLEDGQKVPGISVFTRIGVTITKRRGAK